MAVFLSDTFTDTAGTKLTAHTGETGATWTLAPGDSAGSGANQAVLDGAGLLTGAAANSTIAYASGIPGSADYTVTGVVNTTTSISTTTIVGVGGRMSTSANSGYFAILFNGLKLYRYNAGTLTLIGGSIAVGSQNDLSITLDLSGITIAVRAQRASDSNWLTSGAAWQASQVNCISVTDATHSTAGRAGVWVSQNTSVGKFSSISADGVATTSGTLANVLDEFASAGVGTVTYYGTFASTLDDFASAAYGSQTVSEAYPEWGTRGLKRIHAVKGLKR